MPTSTGLPKAGDLLVSEDYPGVVFEVTERIGNNYPVSLWVARDDGGSLGPPISSHTRNDGREFAVTVENPAYLSQHGWVSLEVPGEEEAWARSMSSQHLARRLLILPGIVNADLQKAVLREAAFRLNQAA